MQDHPESPDESSPAIGPGRQPRAVLPRNTHTDEYPRRTRIGHRTRRYALICVQTISSTSCGCLCGLLVGVIPEVSDSYMARVWMGAVFPMAVLAGCAMVIHWLGRRSRVQSKGRRKGMWVFLAGYALIYFGHLAMLVRAAQR